MPQLTEARFRQLMSNHGFPAKCFKRATPQSHGAVLSFIVEGEANTAMNGYGSIAAMDRFLRVLDGTGYWVEPVNGELLNVFPDG